MRNLLITTIGKDNCLDAWDKGKTKNFDIVTIDYTKTSTFKYPGIYRALRLLRAYDYYWMPDEDISLTTEEINKLFDMAAKYHLDLFQPSVEQSPRSFPSWPMFIHKGNAEMIPMPFVEIMCPGFSREGLLKCIDTFHRSNSGWGLDIIWAKILRYQNMGLINSVSVIHTRPPMKGSNLYSMLKEPASDEMHRLLKEYRVIMIPYVHEEPRHPSYIPPSRRFPHVSPRALMSNRRRKRS